MDRTTALQKIGYNFKNNELLDEAILAAGAPVSDVRVEGNVQGNKGLALIGDALIRLAIVDQGYVDGARTASNNPKREYKKTTLAHGEYTVRRPPSNEVRFVTGRAQDTASLAEVGIAKVLGRWCSYFNADTFSDATVRCSGKEFKVHKLVLSAQSEFFSKAFTGDWKESDSGQIDLEEVDVNVVEAMLHFMYHFDYNNTHGASTMIFNAQVYSVADKYIIPALKAEAREKFGTAISTGWAMDDFPSAIAEVYNSTPESDRGLRDLTVEIARTNINPLRENELFRDVLREIPSFAAEMVISISDTHKKDQKIYRCPNCGKQMGGTLSGGTAGKDVARWEAGPTHSAEDKDNHVRLIRVVVSEHALFYNIGLSRKPRPTILSWAQPMNNSAPPTVIEVTGIHPVSRPSGGLNMYLTLLFAILVVRLIGPGPAGFDPLRLDGAVGRTEEEVGDGTRVRRGIPAESDLVPFVGSDDSAEELSETLQAMT
ncbi:hypothetical protein DL767_002316 [Monosporascus sp. MG133]|nr:hypothetical protein DL767_002316 [Monosporascus sp. MG133]